MSWAGPVRLAGPVCRYSGIAVKHTKNFATTYKPGQLGEPVSRLTGLNFFHVIVFTGPARGQRVIHYSSADAAFLYTKMAEGAGSTSKRTQKFKWTMGIVDDLLGAPKYHGVSLLTSQQSKFRLFALSHD